MSKCDISFIPCPLKRPIDIRNLVCGDNVSRLLMESAYEANRGL